MQAPGVTKTLNLIDYFITITVCNLSYNIVILKYSNYNALNNLAISSLSFEIPTPPRKRPRRMADFIKPKRRSFAEEMGVASKSTGKKLDVISIKPKVEKLMEIKSDPIDETAIKYPSMEKTKHDVEWIDDDNYCNFVLL